MRGARIVDPASGTDQMGDILVDGPTIAAIGEASSRGDERVVQARGLVACPGLVDLHVHFREPGQEH